MSKLPIESQKTAHLRFTLNGEEVEVFFAPYKTLLEVLREDLGHTGTKHGCELGECGACAVLVDGKPILSCLQLALECTGKNVLTVEGLGSDGQLDPLLPAHQLQLEIGAELAVLLNRAMALNPDDRPASAADFRDALLRVDYSRWAVANEFALASPQKSANTVSVSTTVAAPKPEPRRIVIDNLFDNNSILKPRVNEWLLPEPSRMPLCAATMFGFLLLFFIGLRSSAADWFLGDSTTDVVKQDSQLTASGKPLVGSKSVDSRTGRKATNGTSRDLGHRSDKARRTSHR